MLKLFLEVLPITILVAIIYSIFRFAHIRKNNLKVSFTKEIFRLVFICYITGLVNLVLVPSNMWSAFWFLIKHGYVGTTVSPLFSGGFNFVPTLIKCIIGELSLGSWVRDMLVGNLLMFVPFGILLPLITDKITDKRIFAIAILVPSIIEFLQPVVGRSFDVDDITMNFVGIILGFYITKFLIKITKNGAR